MKNNSELYDLILNFLHDLDEIDKTLKIGGLTAFQMKYLRDPLTQFKESLENCTYQAKAINEELNVPDLLLNQPDAEKFLTMLANRLLSCNESLKIWKTKQEEINLPLDEYPQIKDIFIETQFLDYQIYLLLAYLHNYLRSFDLPEIVKPKKLEAPIDKREKPKKITTQEMAYAFNYVFGYATSDLTKQEQIELFGLIHPRSAVDFYNNKTGKHLRKADRDKIKSALAGIKKKISNKVSI